MRLRLVVPVLVLVTVASGCGDTYEDRVQQQFTRQCMENGNTGPSCDCVLEGWQDHFSEEEALRMMRTASFRGLPSEDVETLLALGFRCDTLDPT